MTDTEARPEILSLRLTKAQRDQLTTLAKGVPVSTYLRGLIEDAAKAARLDRLRLALDDHRPTELLDALADYLSSIATDTEPSQTALAGLFSQLAADWDALPNTSQTKTVLCAVQFADTILEDGTDR